MPCVERQILFCVPRRDCFHPLLLSLGRSHPRPIAIPLSANFNLMIEAEDWSKRPKRARCVYMREKFEAIDRASYNPPPPPPPANVSQYHP